MEIAYYFALELINRATLRVGFMSQFANGFTKMLGIDDFMKHRDQHKLVPTVS